MRDLLFPPGPLLQPLVKALTDDYAPLAPLHSRPHTAVFDQRVVATVNRAHQRAIVWLSLGPEWDQSPFHALQFISGALLICRFIVFGISFPAGLCWTGMVFVGDVGAVDRAKVAWGKVVRLSDLVVIRCFVHLHASFFEALANVRQALDRCQ